MSYAVRLYAIIAFCLMSVILTEAKGNAYDQFVSLSSDDLAAKARIFENSSPDSAVVCYSIIGNRYNKDMTDDEKIQCVNALIAKGDVYFYKYFNLASAYESLSKAEELAEESGITMPAVKMQLGIIFHTLCNPYSMDMEAADMAFSNFRNALKEAISVDDSSVADVVSSNLVYLSFMLNRLDSIIPDWSAYYNYREGRPNGKFNYNKGLHKALTFHRKGKFRECVMTFDSLISELPDDENYIRYRLAAHMHQSQALLDAGNFKEAFAKLRAPLKIAENGDIKDVMMEIYGMLALCCRSLHEDNETLYYENRGLRLRDSLINYSQLSKLQEIKTGRNLRKVEARIEQIETRRKNQQKILLLGGIFSGIVMILLVILYSRNKRLRQSNLALYSKNVEIMAQNDKEREMRLEFERKIEEIKSGCIATEVVEEKYKNSPLDDSQKKLLMETIAKIMDETNEYLLPDFTIERLAELAESKSKLVSQVINERQGCNFNNFVNQYRIREACQRINDTDKYGNLTLDAISKSVGFRARSSFFKAFKSVTGLTPSEFVKIARQKES